MSTDQQVTWIACANGNRVATCQHTPRCAPLRPGQRPGEGPFGRYVPAGLHGRYDPPRREPGEVLTVAGALAAYDSRPDTGPGTGLSAVITPNRLAALERLLVAVRAEQAARCEDCGAPLRAGQGDGSSCGPCTALAGVDHTRSTPDEWGMGPAHELAVLRDLADAVRDAQQRG